GAGILERMVVSVLLPAGATHGEVTAMLQQRPFSTLAYVAAVGSVLIGCSVQTSTSPAPAPRAETQAPRPSQASIDPGQAERLKRIMTPLLRSMDHPVDLSRVKVAIMDDPQTNA